MIQEVLDALVHRASPTGPPGLDTVSGLSSVRVWEGPWDELASPQRLSVTTPAALVSLIDLTVVDIGRTFDGLRSLPPAAGASVTPARLAAEARPRPTCRLEVAVTLLAAGADVKSRAASVLGLVEQILVVMVGHAIERIEGVNLNNDKLRQRGLSAFVLAGYREIEIRPAADAAPELPSRVDVVGGLSPRTVYPQPEC